MSERAPQPLLLALVEWVAAAPRPYAEVMEAWRTSCPRLPVWEDALELRLVARRAGAGSEPIVVATPEGLAFLRTHGRTGACASGPQPSPASRGGG